MANRPGVAKTPRPGRTLVGVMPGPGADYRLHVATWVSPPHPPSAWPPPPQTAQALAPHPDDPRRESRGAKGTECPGRFGANPQKGGAPTPGQSKQNKQNAHTTAQGVPPPPPNNPQPTNNVALPRPRRPRWPTGERAGHTWANGIAPRRENGGRASPSGHCGGRGRRSSPRNPHGHPRDQRPATPTKTGARWTWNGDMSDTP